MLKNQEARARISTTDILIASLVELQHAYEKMRLPDFFNSKFNHLQRYKEKKYEASEIGEKITEILNDLSSVLEKLGKKQKDFKEEQDKRMAEALRGVRSTNRGNTQELVERLRILNMQLNSDSLSKVVRWLSKVVGWLSKVVRLLVVVRCRPPQAHGTATPKARTCEASCSASLQHIKS